MCAAVAGLIIFSKMRARTQEQMATTAAADAGTTSSASSTGNAPSTRPTVATIPQPIATAPLVTSTQTTTSIAVHPTVPALVVTTNAAPENDPDTKPLPVLEKDYLATTNRDTRLDVMMDIADAPGPASIQVLSRLFDAETDADLKVDLLDSLLGIEGFVEEKLKLLTKGTQKGLPNDVRQSAIDGLIDLDDQRVVPVLNGLLNDPDEDIRESAKDALEMLQSQPAVKLK